MRKLLTITLPMTAFLLILWLVPSVAPAFFLLLKQRANAAALAARQRADTAEQQNQQETRPGPSASPRAWEESRASVASTMRVFELKLAEVVVGAGRVQEHYPNEALHIHQEAARQPEAKLAEVTPLLGYPYPTP